MTFSDIAAEKQNYHCALQWQAYIHIATEELLSDLSSMNSLTEVSSAASLQFVEHKTHKELYIKYVGGGAGGFLWGVMKYFRHVLMGHEIFFKILDGPQSIFLCFIFVILFFKLRELKSKISKLAINEI